uniref:Small EDRK-rich factor-like N-terminal domain-containing protein n=1 Tax=Hucho hucho TaxID=62062 RepID=A0A4W5J9C6_9TELE
FAGGNQRDLARAKNAKKQGNDKGKKADDGMSAAARKLSQIAAESRAQSQLFSDTQMLPLLKDDQVLFLSHNLGFSTSL